MRTNVSIESRKGKARNICGGELRAPIDAEDDDLMVALKLRNPKIIKHPELFAKTSYEKSELKRLKSNSPRTSQGSFPREKYEVVEGKLTIYLVNTKKDPRFRTTHSVKCYRNEISDVLEPFRKSGLTVSKYYFKY